jgi:pimeloyl-ACP methyl ester carboxylesterase
MAYIKLHPVKQFDFQINRILTYGSESCNLNDFKNDVNKITDFNSWYIFWKDLAFKAEKENRYLHSAYYFRLAEFFLNNSPEKESMYNNSIKNFYKIIDKDKNISKENVPYKGTFMKTLVFKQKNPKGNIIVFGGYDSFIEEFYIAIKELQKIEYDIYLFEGPGQGQTLKNGLTFEPYWEKPIGAILDYYNLENVSVIGISWGGYLALRSAAFDERIKNVVAYDVLYDGFDCMINPFPKVLKMMVKLLFILNAKTLFNKLIEEIMQKILLLKWAINHGKYITGTNDAYDFYNHLKKHTLKGILGNIKCNVLLLAGEKDHYIPKNHYSILMKGIKNAKSINGKMFTEKEGGEEHCQIGNHKLAINYIMDWINKNQD